MIYIQFWTRKKHLKTLSNLLLAVSFAPRGFSPGTPVFPSPQKPTLSNSHSTRNQTKMTLWMCYLQIIFYLFILLHVQSRLKKIEILFKDFQRNFKDFSRKNRIQRLFKTVWTLPIDLLVMTVILEQVQT